MSTPPTKGRVFSKKYQMSAIRQRVFEALTQPKHLSIWFAEHVQVEPRVNGDFKFWGRHTIWCEDESTANQRLTRIDPPNGIAFSWTWNGDESDVTIQLRDGGDKGSTEIEVTHAYARQVKNQECDSTGDFWGVAMGNLRNYLTKGEAALLPDVSRADSESLSVSITIDAPPHEVYLALTEPAELNQWIAKNATVEACVGGRYSYGWEYMRDGKLIDDGPARVRRIVPDKLVETDWHYPPIPNSTVTWELMPLQGGSKTRLTLTHSGFRDELNRSVHTLGWSGYLVTLKRFRESPAAASGQRTSAAQVS